MAGRGINIDFISDVSKFLRGTRDISEALEDVADSLDDLARDADKAGEKAGKGIADGIEGGIDDAGDATKKLERKFKDTFDEVKADSKKAGDDVGDNVKRGFKRAEQGAAEFKDEAKSTAREGAASFTGEFEDVADVIQETLANALAGFGPMGAVAGMAAAAGIGILVSVLQSSADKAAETKEKVIDLAGAIREAGGDIESVDWGSVFEDFANAIADPKSWFEPWQRESKTNAEIIAADAERLGLNYRTLFRGLAGDSEAGAAAIEQVSAAIVEQEQKFAALVAGGMDPTAAAMQVNSTELQTLRGRLEDATEATEQAITLSELYAEAVEGSTTAVEDFNEAQEERLGLLRDEAEMNMSAAEAAAAWAEQQAENRTRLEEINALIDQTDDATRAATDAITENGAALDLNTAAGRLASQTLIDTAKAGMDNVEAMQKQGASAEELEAATQRARDEFVRTAIQMGLSEQAAQDLATQYGLIPSTVKTTAQFDTTAARYDIDKFIKDQSGRTIVLRVGASGATTYRYSSTGPAAENSGGSVRRAASGLYVADGAGSDIDDRVHTLLSPGEFVVDAQATQQVGVGNLQQLNEGMNPFATRPTVARSGGTVRIHPDDVQAIADAIVAGAHQIAARSVSTSASAVRMAGRPV